MALIKCRGCGNDISDKASCCPHCGKSLSEQGEAIAQNEARKCTECGAILSESDTVCKNCGCPLEYSDENTNAGKQSNLKNDSKTPIYKKKAFLITLIAVVVAIAGGIMAYSMLKTPEEEVTYDTAFIDDLKKGLMNRWDCKQKIEDSENSYLGKLVDIELNAIGDYSNRKFADSTLQEKVIIYINLLKEQKESLTYYTSDYVKFSDLWEEARLKRTQQIAAFINEYNLKFPSRYDENVKDIMDSSKVANERDVLKEKIEKMRSSIQFNLTKDEYGFKYYEALIENTTDKDFKSFIIYIKLTDNSGVVVDTQAASLQDFKAGQTSKAEFMTNKDFAKYDISFDYFID